MIFQQIKYGCLDDKGQIEGKRDKDNEPVRPFTCSPGKIGRIESFDNDWGWRRTGRFTGINGKVQPPLSEAKAGAFERWRLINAGSGETDAHAALSPRPRRAAAADRQGGGPGRVARTLLHRPASADVADRPRRADPISDPKVDEAILFAGERMDVLARLPEAGHYCMVNDTSRTIRKRLNPLAHDRHDRRQRRSAPGIDGDALLQSTLARSAEKALAGRNNPRTATVLSASSRTA